ncbi:MAG: WhiB family transcriptional regulator [Actinobacteria bacterium]|nr:WhiB family transcriptional regulator [Actinomycetota bacterium]
MAVHASLLLDSATWRDEAECRSTDPGLFFPVGNTGMALEQIDDAKEVCYGCNARELCLEFALVTNQDAGVWGGASEEERREIRRARRRAALAVRAS